MDNEQENNEAPVLTPREKQSLMLIASGRTFKEDAVMMGCSVRTVRAHLDSAKEKTNSKNLPHLVERSWLLGILRKISIIVFAFLSFHADINNIDMPRKTGTKPYKSAKARRREKENNSDGIGYGIWGMDV